MSIEGVPRFRSAGERLARFAAPLAVLAVGFAVLLGEQMRIEHELHLLAPRTASPGELLPFRAILFGGLDEAGGPRLVRATSMTVRLSDGEGRAVAEEQFEPGPIGAEGALELPRKLTGPHTLEAVAQIEGRAVASASIPLELTPEPRPAPMIGRLASALQVLELGPVRGASPPDALEVRVVAGACVPEHPCELLVHVGKPAASVRIEPSPSVSAEGESAPTSGLASLSVVVHGPEARTELVALRDGEEVARRSIQLPVALATPAVAPMPSILASDEPLVVEAQAFGEPRPLIADLYREGAWIRTRTLEPGTATAMGPLPPGLFRLQVHADPFSSERAAVRTVLVLAPGEEEPTAVERTLSRRGVARDVPPGPSALRLAWSCAAAENRLRSLPEWESGRAADEARLSKRRSVLRVAALIALGLGLLVAALAFFRRGVDAALEAQRVMEATGDPVLVSARHRRRTLASALLLCLTLLLALVAAAALIVARARLLG